MKKIILIIIAVVSLAGGGAVGFFAKDFLGKKDGSGEETAADTHAKDEEHGEEDSGHGAGHEDENGGGHGGGHGEAEEVLAKLAPFTVNLADQGLRQHYLRATLHLSLRQETDKESLEESTPRIRDAVLTLLSNKKTEELLTIEGKTQLRGEITEQVNTVMGKGEAVKGVYFVEFLIQ